MHADRPWTLPAFPRPESHLTHFQGNGEQVSNHLDRRSAVHLEGLRHEGALKELKHVWKDGKHLQVSLHHFNARDFEVF